MHIIQVASELTPLIKVGGLADVVQGLSKELVRRGHTVEIFLPFYTCLNQEVLTDLKVILPQFEVKTKQGSISSKLYSAVVDKLNVFLIAPLHNTSLFSSGTVYGGADEIGRFIYFCLAANEALTALKKKPDILHLHDWPTALLAALNVQNPTSYKPKATVLTIHNLHHQGHTSESAFVKAGISLPQETLALFKQGEGINLLKGGIESADQISTVSPQYNLEIQTLEGSCGLQDVVIRQRSKIQGILNGIDADFWNPANDRYLDFHYETDANPPPLIEQIIQGKAKNKENLYAHLGLSFSPNKPLVAAITRLVPQKSPELIKHALYRTLEKGGQFILLGSSPIPAIQAEFEVLQRECAQGTEARIIMDTDEKLAHQIYAASDLFLIPSLFEPCGLTQIIALRYGSIPLARYTGGLVNTVFDILTASIPEKKRNGFTFDHPDKQGIDWALMRALDYYYQQPEKWQALMLQGMSYDFSWKQSSLDYIALYKKALRGY